MGFLTGSTKQMELGVIAPSLFSGYIEDRFARTGRRIDPAVVGRVLDATLGHPSATQELCYFLWAETPDGAAVGDDEHEVGLEKLLRAEHAHFSLLWERSARVHGSSCRRSRPSPAARSPALIAASTGFPARRACSARSLRSSRTSSLRAMRQASNASPSRSSQSGCGVPTGNAQG